MNLLPGNKVYVKTLKKVATLLSISGQKARVALGDLQLQCKVSDLAIAPVESHTKTAVPAVVTRKNQGSTRALERLDLHGFTTAEAQRKIEEHVNAAILAGLDRFDIIHGLGTGRVRDATHACLGGLQVVKNFHIDMLNPGVTKVFLG